MKYYENIQKIWFKIKRKIKNSPFLLSLYNFILNIAFFTRVKRNNKLLSRSKNQILKLNNSHYGETCFIIGNGPSLNCKDLEKLEHVITFGTNAIFNMFQYTDWRPVFYCVQDDNFLKKYFYIIDKEDILTKFIGISKYSKYKEVKNGLYIPILLHDFYPSLPKFSDNIAAGEYQGYTVTYMCLQIAAYMGFKEIYLLGVDHSYSISLRVDGTIEHNDVKDHFSDSDVLVKPLWLIKLLKSMQMNMVLKSTMQHEVGNWKSLNVWILTVCFRKMIKNEDTI